MKICLIGSTKFREDYERVAKQLSLAGHTVYSVSCFARETNLAVFDYGVDDPLPQPAETLTEDQKMVLDLVHLHKILLSDCVVLVGEKDGRPYHGVSTTRELVWARMHEKHIVIARDIGTKTWDSIDDRDPVSTIKNLIDELAGRAEGNVLED